jgi:hypothetical protein
MPRYRDRDLARQLLHSELTVDRIAKLTSSRTVLAGAERLLIALRNTWDGHHPVERQTLWTHAWVLIGGALVTVPDEQAVPWIIHWGSAERAVGHPLENLPPPPDLFRVLIAPRLIQFATAHSADSNAPAALRLGLGSLRHDSKVMIVLRQDMADVLRSRPQPGAWRVLLETWARIDSGAGVLMPAVLGTWNTPGNATAETAAAISAVWSALSAHADALTPELRDIWEAWHRRWAQTPDC